MNDSEWFRLNPERLVRRRRLQGDPEMWILSMHDTSETLLVQGRLPTTDVSDSALHDVATEFLLEGIVGAERIEQALRLALDSGPMTSTTHAAKSDEAASADQLAFRAVWPSFAKPETAAAETGSIDRF